MKNQTDSDFSWDKIESWDTVQKSKQRFSKIGENQNTRNWLLNREIILTTTSNPDLSMKSRTDSDS